MGAPVVCAECETKTRTSFLASECRYCGAGLPGKPPPPRRPAGTRVPAAEWVGPNADVHQIWTAADTLAPLDLSFDLHDFLDYCALLRRLREAFTAADATTFFDACLFFLRGSYGLWAYLNTSSDLALRATVFGGLNHGPSRKPVFLSWLHGAFAQAAAANRRHIDVAIVDEVDSGTGIGTQMNVIHEALEQWPGPHLDMRITYIAVARPEHEADQLAASMRKWRQGRTYPNGTLAVVFTLLLGNLIAYDDDELLGIARRQHGYAVTKRQGSTIDVRCPTCCHGDCGLALATAGTQNESIANLAAAIASARQTAPVRLLDGTIARLGCPRCEVLWGALRPSVPRPALDLRDHRGRFLRALCRRLCALA